ncbi:hypothetical protein PO124_22470 [Bacillus licheniformis]|nr:hypothetical protein [Bacillus licheniformis]
MGFNPLQLVIDAYKKVTLPWLNNTPIVSPFLYTMTLMQRPIWNNSAKSLVTAIILAITADSIKLGKKKESTCIQLQISFHKGSDNNEETGENALDLFLDKEIQTILLV